MVWPLASRRKSVRARGWRRRRARRARNTAARGRARPRAFLLGPVRRVSSVKVGDRPREGSGALAPGGRGGVEPRSRACGRRRREGRRGARRVCKRPPRALVSRWQEEPGARRGAAGPAYAAPQRMAGARREDAGPFFRGGGVSERGRRTPRGGGALVCLFVAPCLMMLLAGARFAFSVS